MRYGRSFLFAALLLPTAIGAQTVVGRVIERDSQRPAQKVTVAIIRDTGSISASVARTETDSLGDFLLVVPAPGQYRLSFSVRDQVTFIVPVFTLAADQVIQREFVIPMLRSGAFTEFDVERPVEMLPGNDPPEYPEALRKARVQGDVLVQFVVDSTGNAVMSTVKFLRSSHIEFTWATRDAIRKMRFVPAELHQRKVSQVVLMPFQFRLTGGLPVIPWPTRRP
jgi:TonB family protein